MKYSKALSEFGPRIVALEQSVEKTFLQLMFLHEQNFIEYELKVLQARVHALEELKTTSRDTPGSKHINKTDFLHLYFDKCPNDILGSPVGEKLDVSKPYGDRFTLFSLDNAITFLKTYHALESNRVLEFFQKKVREDTKHTNIFRYWLFGFDENSKYDFMPSYHTYENEIKKEWRSIKEILKKNKIFFGKDDDVPDWEPLKINMKPQNLLFNILRKIFQIRNKIFHKFSGQLSVKDVGMLKKFLIPLIKLFSYDDVGRYDARRTSFYNFIREKGVIDSGLMSEDEFLKNSKNDWEIINLPKWREERTSTEKLKK